MNWVKTLLKTNSTASKVLILDVCFLEVRFNIIRTAWTIVFLQKESRKKHIRGVLFGLH